MIIYMVRKLKEKIQLQAPVTSGEKEKEARSRRSVQQQRLYLSCSVSSVGDGYMGVH